MAVMALSPNGKMLVWDFGKYVHDPDAMLRELWVSQYDGSDMRLLWKGKIDDRLDEKEEARWLPDNSAITFLFQGSFYKISVK